MFTPTEQQQPNATVTTATTAAAATASSLKQLFDTIFSYDGNVMLAALVCLLLVILFVLILHVYAKWFLAQAQHRRHGGSTPMTVVSRVLGPNRFHHFQTFTLDASSANINNISTSATSSKGLDSKTVSAIPLFVYKTEVVAEEATERNYKVGALEMECVICLSPFEDNDVGRNLPKCGHCFHVECIDMWLDSHTNCPICRSPITYTDGIGNTTASDQAAVEGESVVIDVLDSGYVPSHDLVHVGVMGTDSESTSSSSSSSSSPLTVGCSLKRMLSRSRPEIFGKVFPAANGNDQLDN